MLRTGRGWLAVAAAVVVAAVLWTVTTTSAGAAGARVAVGAPVTVPMLSAVNGPLAGGTTLHLSVALEPRDPAALASYATAVSTPGSAQFGRYLTVAQFAARFGATAAAISAVSTDLRAAGLSVAAATANGLLLPVSGTATQIDRALSVSLQSVTLLRGRTTYANLSAPSLPADVGRYVQGVVGLDGIDTPQPAGVQERAGSTVTATPGALRGASTVAPHALAPRVVTGGPQPSPTCQSAMSADGLDISGDYDDGAAYTFDEQAADYGFSSLYAAGDLGAGQTVAVVEFGGYNASDITAFQACYGTSATVTQVNVGGGPGTGAVTGDGEQALDIETIIGLAPRATVDVYQAPTSDVSQVDILNRIASDNTAKVVSDSYGLCESAAGATVTAAESTALDEMATQGQSFFAASGDSGSAMCSQLGRGYSGYNTGLSVIDPGSQPFATAVGGTTLFSVLTPASGSTPGTIELDTNGAAPSEVVWNDGPNSDCGCASGADGGGSGGGISLSWSMPGYQSGAAASLGVVATPPAGATVCAQKPCREVPDVAADADGNTGYAIYDTYESSTGWGDIGGTSAAAPLWAAFAALTDASAGCQSNDLGFVNPALYGIASTAYAANFNDVNVVASLETTSNGTTSANQPTDNDTFQGYANLDTPANGNYPTKAGYDLATGLGSMKAAALSASLCRLQTQKATLTLANPGSQSATVGSPFSLQISATDSNGATVSYSATGLPAGLSISSSGAITGTPTTAGTATVTVTGTDAFGAAGSTSFTIAVAAAPVAAAPSSPSEGSGSVGSAGSASAASAGSGATTTSNPTAVKGRPTISGASLTGVKIRAAKLSFTVTHGANAAGVRALVITLPSGLSFRRTAKALKQGVSIRGGAAVVRLVRGRLTITFTKAVAGARVTVSSKLITTSAAVAQQAGARQPPTVSARVAVIDASRTVTTVAVSLKL